MPPPLAQPPPFRLPRQSRWATGTWGGTPEGECFWRNRDPEQQPSGLHDERCVTSEADLGSAADRRASPERSLADRALPAGLRQDIGTSRRHPLTLSQDQPASHDVAGAALLLPPVRALPEPRISSMATGVLGRVSPPKIPGKIPRTPFSGYFRRSGNPSTHVEKWRFGPCLTPLWAMERRLRARLRPVLGPPGQGSPFPQRRRPGALWAKEPSAGSRPRRSPQTPLVPGPGLAPPTLGYPQPPRGSGSWGEPRS